jgi:hypothetical protein
MKPYCHRCVHVELMPTGPMFCTATMRVLPTRVARMEGEECGPEGRLYEEQDETDFGLEEGD